MHAKFQLDRTSPSDKKKGGGVFSLRSLFPSKVKTQQNLLEAVDSNLANLDNFVIDVNSILLKQSNLLFLYSV